MDGVAGLPHPSGPRSASPADRARAQLLDEPDLPDTTIGKLADASPSLVGRTRAELEALGHIPVRDPGLSDDAYRRDAAGRARDELLSDPARSNMIIASQADCHRETVLKIRRELEAAGEIPVVGRWERKGRPHATQLPADLDRHAELPPMPESMRAGLCASGQYDPALWHPGPGQGGRNTASRAIAICRRCPALDDCASWSMSLPGKDRSIYGAMLSEERIRHQRAQRAQPAP